MHFDRAALMFQRLFWEQYSHELAIAVLRFQRLPGRNRTTRLIPKLMPKCEKCVSDVMQEHLKDGAPIS